MKYVGPYRYGELPRSTYLKIVNLDVIHEAIKAELDFIKENEFGPEEEMKKAFVRIGNLCEEGWNTLSCTGRFVDL